MPFDYQMVTYEEIIKNDFFKWAQDLTFANGKVRVLQKTYDKKRRFSVYGKSPFFIRVNLEVLKCL
jgi:predicted metal-dependent HD superfamily phosphohydrolase